MLTVTLLITMLSCFAFADTKADDLDLGGVTDVMSKAYIKGVKAHAFSMFENKYKEYFGGDDYAMLSGYSLILDGYRYKIDHRVYPTREYFLVTAEGNGNYAGHYNLYITSELGGSYEWDFYGYTPNGAGFRANGTTALTDTHLTQTQINGTRTQQELEIATVRVNEFRTKALLFLKRVLVDMGVGCEFYDLGFNKNYFDGYSCGDSHFYTDYFYNNDATADRNGTKTAACVACGLKDVIIAPDTKLNTAFEEFVAAVVALGSTDAYGNPGFILPADEQNPENKFFMVSVASEPLQLVFMSYAEGEHIYALQIDSALGGSYKWTLETPISNGGVSTYGFTKKTDTKLSTVTLEQPHESDIKNNLAKSLAKDLRTQSVAFLQLLIELMGLECDFSDFGFNDKYFCTRAHMFSDYAYNGDATATLDGTKTSVCKNCGYRTTVTADNTAGTSKTAFDTVARFLILTNPENYTAAATVQNDGATVEYSVGYDKKYDVITTKIVTDYDGKTVTYSFDITRALDGNYKCYLSGKYNDSYAVALDTTAVIPNTVNGGYNVTYFSGSDSDRAELQQALSAFTSLSATIFIDFAKAIDSSLTVSDFGFDKHFLCDVAHTLVDPVYNNDATYEKDGTQTGICYYCGDSITVSVFGTKLVDIKDSSKVFTDVKNKWYKKAVDYCYSYGFIAGMEKDRFGLDNHVTRGMFITVLARIAGVNTSGSANKVQTKFSDVKSGKYYTAAIKWGVENGIVSGVSKTAFSPEANITREQICVMIVNFADFIGIDIDARVNPVTFTDNSNISSWAKNAVRICQLGQIVSGYEENGRMYFKPAKTATRAEAAQILYKFHDEFINIY